MAPPPTVAVRFNFDSTSSAHCLKNPDFSWGHSSAGAPSPPLTRPIGPVSQTEVSSYARVNIDPLRRLLQDRLVTDV